MKRRFTLIELIIVIVVIGILSAIVIPNISGIKDKASYTAINSDRTAIQMASDLYLVDTSDFPTKGIPLIDNPLPVDFDFLYPDKIRNLPKTEGVKYWVNYQGTVFASTADSPKGLTVDDNKLKWDKVPEAETYNIYQIVNPKVNSTASHKGSIELISSTTETTYVINNNENIYLVSSIDKHGLESPAVGKDYLGHKRLVDGPNGLVLDGISNTVKIPYHNKLDGMRNGLTMEFWVKTSTEGGEREYIIDKMNHYTGNNWDSSYMFRLNVEGELEVRLIGEGNEDKRAIHSTTPINDGKWHHVAYVWDKPNSYLYIDGKLDRNITALSFKGPINAFESELYLGSRKNNRIEGTSDYFEGELYDVRIWDKARSHKEIYTNMYKNLKGNENGLVGSWNLDNLQGNNFPDNTPYKNNGKLLGE